MNNSNPMASVNSVYQSAINTNNYIKGNKNPINPNKDKAQKNVPFQY